VASIYTEMYDKMEELKKTESFMEVDDVKVYRQA